MSTKINGCSMMLMKMDGRIFMFSELFQMIIYGYGVDYDEQSGRLTLTSQEYPKNFHIDYPNNITIIDKDEVVNNVLRSLSIELEEYF